MTKSRIKVKVTPLAIGFIFLWAGMAFVTCASAADVVVVANSNVAEKSLSKDKLSAIFLGQMTTWSNGSKVEFVTLKDNSSTHEAFLSKYIGRSSSQFSNFWKQQVFTGKGRMPKQVDSESNLIEYVSANKGAIGYVSAGATRGSAKVITIE